jgi:hypothetical protein
LTLGVGIGRAIGQFHRDERPSAFARRLPGRGDALALVIIAELRRRGAFRDGEGARREIDFNRRSERIAGQVADGGADPISRLAPLKISAAVYGTMDDRYPETIRVLKRLR